MGLNSGKYGLLGSIRDVFGREKGSSAHNDLDPSVTENLSRWLSIATCNLSYGRPARRASR